MSADHKDKIPNLEILQPIQIENFVNDTHIPTIEALKLIENSSSDESVTKGVTLGGTLGIILGGGLVTIGAINQGIEQTLPDLTNEIILAGCLFAGSVSGGAFTGWILDGLNSNKREKSKEKIIEMIWSQIPIETKEQIIAEVNRLNPEED